MKKNKLYTVIPGVIALAVFALFYRPSYPVESVAGIISTLSVLGLMALEYRISWRRFFSRN